VVFEIDQFVEVEIQNVEFRNLLGGSVKSGPTVAGGAPFQDFCFARRFSWSRRPRATTCDRCVE